MSNTQNSKRSCRVDLHVVIAMGYTVSHFSYAPFFQGPHVWTKMLELNILYDNLLIDSLSV